MSEGQRLEGVRVLVTRPRERSESLWFLLEDEGAEVIAVPMLELVPPDDPRPLRAAAEQVHRYRWILFTSPSGVHGFIEAARLAGTVNRLRQVKLGAVGAATAAALESLGQDVSVLAQTPTGTGLFEAMQQDLQAGDEVLLPSAQEGRKELEAALLEAGAAVTRVAAYKGLPQTLSAEQLEALTEAPPHASLFASPRQVEAFLSAEPDKTRAVLSASRLVALGPTTAAALQGYGFSAVTVAQSPSAEGLVDAVVQAVRGGVC